MGIPMKMESTVTINVTDATLTTYSAVKVEFKQGQYCLQKTPVIVSDTELAVTITADEAMKFNSGMVGWQVICKDADGNNLYTPIYSTPIDRILGGEW